jgi:PAS domain S-box-containing protein
LKAPSALPHQVAQEFKGSLTRTILILLLILSFLPVSIIGLSTIFRSRQILRDQALFQLKGAVKAQEFELDRLALQGQQALLDSTNNQDFMSALLDYLDNPQDPQKQDTARMRLDGISNRLTSQFWFDQILIMSPSGKIILSTDRASEDKDLKDLNNFATLVTRAKSFAYFNPAPLYPNQLIIFNAYPVLNSSGQVLAYLLGTTFSNGPRSVLVTMTSFFPSSQAFFLTNDNQVLALSTSGSSDVSLLNIQENFKTRVNNLLKNQEGALVSNPIRANSSGFLYTYWFSKLQMGLVVEIPQSVVYQQISLVNQFNIILFAITLLISFVTVYFASSRLVSPLVQLMNNARKFTEGDWTQRAKINRRDEIGLLAHTFNNMVEQLSELYFSLENKVAERTEQIRLAADVAQVATSTSDRQEILSRTVNLLVERLGYTASRIFLLDSGGSNATLEAESAKNPDYLLETGTKKPISSDSLMGWVALNNQSRVLTPEDRTFFQIDLPPEDILTEAAIPVTASGQVLGVMTVQSTQLRAFDSETVSILQTLANQIANGLQNIRLLDSTKINLQETSLLYRSSRQISQARTDEETVQLLKDTLAKTQYVTGVYSIEKDRLVLSKFNDPYVLSKKGALQGTSLPLLGIVEQLTNSGSTIITDLNQSNPYESILAYFVHRGCRSSVVFPLKIDNQIKYIIVAASKEPSPINETSIQPLENMVEVTSVTLNRIRLFNALQDHLNDAQSALQAYNQEHFLINTLLDNTPDQIFFKNSENRYIRVSQSFAKYANLQSPDQAIGKTGSEILGPDEGFEIDEQEKIVMESRQAEIGQVEKSSREGIDLWYLKTLIPLYDGDQKSLGLLGISRDITPLKQAEQESEYRAGQLRVAAEIAEETASTLNLDELLKQAVNLVLQRFNFYHASIFLLDPIGEFAVLRESTGYAGERLKLARHKLAVGSTSIVGQATGRKEPLVINDVTSSPTYYANPLLPNTRSELAIPLMVGNRLLGAMDVQSDHKDAFEPKDISVLRTLSNQLAIAVLNAELYAQSQENIARQRLIYQITSAATSNNTLQEALLTVVKGLQTAIPDSKVAILLLDNNQTQMTIQATAGYGALPADRTNFQVGEGIVGQVAEQKRPLLLRDTQTESLYIQLDQEVRSELAVPIIYSDRLMGVLNLEHVEIGAFNENDLEILTTFGNSLGAVISNIELVNEIRMQVDRERLLFEATNRIRRSVDLQTILQTSVAEICKATGATRASIEISPTINPPLQDNGNGNNGKNHPGNGKGAL